MGGDRKSPKRSSDDSTGFDEKERLGCPIGQPFNIQIYQRIRTGWFRNRRDRPAPGGIPGVITGIPGDTRKGKVRANDRK